jgi:hypothetical protein
MMALSVNLRTGATRHVGSRKGNTKQRVFLAILLLSGLVGAGAVVELFAGPYLKRPE